MCAYSAYSAYKQYILHMLWLFCNETALMKAIHMHNMQYMQYKYKYIENIFLWIHTWIHNIFHEFNS